MDVKIIDNPEAPGDQDVTFLKNK